MKSSILVPVHNESATLALALKRLLEVEFPCPIEVIVVDDGSTDGCADHLEDESRIQLIRHGRNLGKGAAIRSGLQVASGDFAVVFDADLEYLPGDITKLLAPVLDGDATVVYGTRTFGSHTAYSFWYVIGNKFVTMAANVLFNSWISDLETCFKLMPVQVFRELKIRSNGFGMEAEVTAKLLKAGYRPYEVPISYTARSREEGKKLTWRDGVEALWILAKVRAGWGGRIPKKAFR